MMNMSLGRHFFLSCLFMLCTALSTASCDRTRQMPANSYPNFLGDDTYKLLERGEGPHQAYQRYLNPNADIHDYNAIYIDPSFVIYDDSGDMTDEDQKNLVNIFYASLAEELGKDYRLVSSPASNTMHFKFAIREATRRNVTLDTITSVTPIGLAASAVAEQFSGKPSFTGTFGAEVLVTDAVTGELLAAAIDRRAGKKQIRSDQWNSWADVAAITKLYAELIRYRLCEQRGDDNCVAPPV